MAALHFLLCISLVICGYFVGFSSTPINSVLFLILTFCSSAGILFIFAADFLGLILIIVYVGAVAVLFLFVIMMLDVKVQAEKSTKNFAIYFLVVAFFALYTFLEYGSVYFFLDNFNQIFSFLESFNQFLVLDNLNNIDILGQVLYNYYLTCVLVAGLILLVALVGAIILTLKFRMGEKQQLTFRQLSRTDFFISFFK